MIIKVCGMRDAENIRQVEKLGVDWIGFIFYPPSARFVGDAPAYIPSRAKKVGVFVDEPLSGIKDKIEKFQLDALQLHGNETPEFCDELGGIGVKIIKAFPIPPGGFPAVQVLRYEGKCDYFLFDTQTAGYGGSGKKFNWDSLSAYRGDTSFLLSGGISPSDTEEILAFSHPRFAGIDINSGFEDAPAQKNIPSVQTFIEKIKKI
ncbi:MAG: phosphoribosylanthranilate isomerase [Dysgonamonadaceae bacterium]|jgi:phosphoribosylanthranilate isomerase|nr:phosphoribosylanthranilate isomerase [Dysgonamonadaceae bacterium]